MTAVELFGAAVLFASVAFMYIDRADRADAESRMPRAQCARALMRSGALKRWR
jgi:hypothetical protein